MDLNLNLIYNSLVWNKSGSEMLFDIDHDWLAPGWHLGFGKMVMMGTAGAMIIEPDGTRHSFSGKVFTHTYPAHPPNQPFPFNVLTFKGQTTDGSNIEYRSEGDHGVARYPNGTVVYYNNYTGTVPLTYLYPRLIVDSNGNAIRISYQPAHCEGLPDPSTEPRIQRIVDTVGRVINFHYDTQKRLTSISGPGLPDGNGNATTRTFVRLHYKTQSLVLTGAFSNLTTRAKSETFSAIDAIYYPATNTGYWFGGNDSYSTYGMLKKVVEERGMGFVPGSNSDEQGTITEGTLTRQQVYDYPSSPSALIAAPTFENVTENWDGGVSSVATTFATQNNSGLNERTVTITHPNGTKTIQKSFSFSNPPSGDPNKFKDGLVKEEQALDSAGDLLQKTTFEWEKGSDDAPRLKRTEITDELGQTMATDYDFYGASNSIGRIREYDYNLATIRTTRNTYVSYLDNDLEQGISPGFGIRIIHPRRVNLVESARVFTGDDSANNLAAQTDFKYDEYPEPLKAYTPDYLNSLDLYVCGEPRQPNGITGILDHSANFNPMPFNSQNGGGAGDQYITTRGNITSTKRYADTSNPSAPANPVTETRTYDMAGNLIAASRACCEQTSSVFDLPTQYAFPLSQTRGSADSSSLLRVTTSVTYDLKTGLPLSRTDANGRQTTMSYYSDSLRPKEIVSPTGARVIFEYDDAAMKVTQTTRLSLNGAIAGQTVKFMNGLGQVRREEALGANNIVDIVETIYDQFGRLSRQSRPYRSAETPQFKETIYDAAGRIAELREPYSDAQDLALNGTITRSFYNEPSRPAGASLDPGQTTRTVDPWGRWRWMRLNASGKLAEVVEPDPAGGNGFATKYIYDAVNNLVTVEQGDQVRRFRYDSLGRLTQQKLAEAGATLDDAGIYHSSGGTWSDVFNYDGRSNMISHTDARGVRTVFSYQDGHGNDDPLNRLQSVSYDISGVDTSTWTVLPAATVAYQYRTKPSASSLIDVTQVEQITATGVSAEVFDYDTEGRLQEKRFTFNGRSQPMTTTYGYDNLGRISQMTYPEQYQAAGSGIRKVVTPSYDVASRMDGLQVNGIDYASQINYNAASQITSLSIGTSANQLSENYQYDLKSGLLTNQKVQRTGNTLMNLAYFYQRGFPCGNCDAEPAEPEPLSMAYTGQVTKIVNSVSGKTQDFSYDSLGRLSQAGQGAWVWVKPDLVSIEEWIQSYSYDQYGNRTGVIGYGVDGNGAGIRDGYGSLTYESTSNRITTTGFTYDAAGNQITAGTGQVIHLRCSGTARKGQGAKRDHARYLHLRRIESAADHSAWRRELKREDLLCLGWRRCNHGIL